MLSSINSVMFRGIKNNNFVSQVKFVCNEVPNLCDDEENCEIKIPASTYRAYAMNNISFSGKGSTTVLKGLQQEFRMPANKGDFSNVINEYSPYMKSVLSDFAQRIGKKGQFLNWVELPANQLRKNKFGITHLDEVIAQSDLLKSRTNSDGTIRPLVVLGIGGSKHTAEFLSAMSGVGTKGKLHFYSDIDPISFKNFLDSNGGKASDLNFLVVSKSGTTFETADAFKRFENQLINEYKKSGMTKEQAILKAQEHFAICTDMNATAKNMRGKIGSVNGQDNGYIKELYVHDDVGGRFSMFDDPSLFAISYAGVPKRNITRILNSADRVNKMCLSDDLASNPAAKSAIFNTYSRDNGFGLVQHNYYGGIFELGAENWTKQLYLESLKDFDYAVGKACDSMHYATEGHFSPNNRSKYNTVMTIMDTKISDNYKKYTGALAATYNETTPLTIETLKVEKGAISPEAIGEFIQKSHFQTVYEGMLRRSVKSESTSDILPEVLQPSVEAYKNKFKQGSPFELNPGK